MGSFGAVWAGEDGAGKPLAIKEIICSSHADLLNALFEGHLLRTLGSRSPSASSSYNSDWQRSLLSHAPGDAPSARHGGTAKLPVLVACETSQLGAEQWRIRLVMTRIFGEPLDGFLKRSQDKARQRIAGPAWPRREFGEACRFARELLVQLAPPFEEISGVALHRDVNAHNILIDETDRPVPCYGLVDFGLAVDASCWQRDDAAAPIDSRPSRVGQDGASTWHHLDVGGDCRYWPVSAWVQFLLGWTELDANPPLRYEYQTQLDFHSLGLTALQVFVEMLPPLTSHLLSSPDLRSDDHMPLISSICAMQVAWERYWSHVSPLHAQLMDTFHNGGDWDALKTECLDKDVHGTISEQLRDLRTALADAADACRTAPADTGAYEALGLFAVLQVLISSGRGGHEQQGHGPSGWREVAAMLGGGLLGDAEGSEVTSASPCNAGAHAAASGASTGSTIGRSHGREAEVRARAAISAMPTPSSPLPQFGTAASDRTFCGDAMAPGGSGSGGGDDMLLRLSYLRDRVDWLAREMGKMGDKRPYEPAVF